MTQDNSKIIENMMAFGKAQEKVDKWNEHVELNLDNETKLTLFQAERNKANESLKEARAYHLQLSQNYHQDANSDVAALDAKERASTVVATIMKYDIIEDIPNSHGMKVMRNIPDLETGKEYGTLIMRNITEKFWKACIEPVAKKGR